MVLSEKFLVESRNNNRNGRAFNRHRIQRTAWLLSCHWRANYSRALPWALREEIDRIHRSRLQIFGRPVPDHWWSELRRGLRRFGRPRTERCNSVVGCGGGMVNWICVQLQLEPSVGIFIRPRGNAITTSVHTARGGESPHYGRGLNAVSAVGLHLGTAKVIFTTALAIMNFLLYRGWVFERQSRPVESASRESNEIPSS